MLQATKRKPVPFPIANTTLSYWLDTIGGTPPAPYSSKNDLFDAVVIGGGISGWSVALHLGKLRPNWRIAVVESRDTVAAGATGRNGGLLWPNIHSNISEYAKKLGNEEAMKIYHFDHANVKALVAFCQEFTSNYPDKPDPLCTRLENRGIQSISNDMELKTSNDDSKFLSSQRVDTSSIRESLNFSLLKSRIPLSLFNVKPAKSFVADLHAHHVQPARLVLAIATVSTDPSLIERNAIPTSFFPNTTVTCIHRPARTSDSCFSLQTNTGETITTKKVIHATNAWASALLPDFPIIPVRNQVVASEPIRDSKWKNQAWGMSVNDGFEYYSERPDGSVVLGGMRYLSEGMDVGVSDDRAESLNGTVSKSLRKYLGRMFDGVVEKEVQVENEWAGIMGFTVDGFPFVGELKGEFNTGIDGRKGCGGEFIIAGFTGHGMSRCFLSAEALAKMVAGGKVPNTFPQSFMISKERLERSTDRKLDVSVFGRLRSCGLRRVASITNGEGMPIVALVGVSPAFYEQDVSMNFQSTLPEIAVDIVKHLPITKDLQTLALCCKSVFTALILDDPIFVQSHIAHLRTQFDNNAGLWEFLHSDLVSWAAAPLSYKKAIFVFLIQAPDEKYQFLMNSSFWPLTPQQSLEVTRYIASLDPFDWCQNDQRLLAWAGANNFHSDAVKLILEQHGVDPTFSNNLPIVDACRNGHIEVVRLLMKNQRVDPSGSGVANMKWGSSGKSNAAVKKAIYARHYDIVNLLLTDRRVKIGDLGDDIWEDALQNKDTVLMEFLEKYAICTMTSTLFRTAVWFGHAEFLASKIGSMDPACHDNYGIRYAAAQGHTGVVKYLLSTGKVDPSADGQYALKWACVRGHLEIVKMLLKDERVDPSVDDNFAFKGAAAHGHPDVLELLLRDPRVKPTAENLKYTREWAEEKEHSRVLELLANIEI
ncbi:UNVERIFIED_CONTAM: hypothetical protein HDU68_008731 [Siphonaria sp. JEL0065]|nr:hypothetical protein HDU68_008731 [Siphonaria sp. JEL0065]